MFIKNFGGYMTLIKILIGKVKYIFFLATFLSITTSCRSSQNNPVTSTTVNKPQTCDPNAVKEWITITSLRRQELDDDLDILATYKPENFDDLIPYKNRAYSRYNQQISQITPSCLSDTQKLVVEEFRLFWKFVEAGSLGNINNATDYSIAVLEITGKVDEAMILAIKHTIPATKNIPIPSSTANLFLQPTQTAIITPTSLSQLSQTPVDQQLENYKIRPEDRMMMAYIPAGDFIMGSTDDDERAMPDEKPQHIVYLDSYWIDIHEVTNQMFGLFVESTTYQTTAERVGTGWVYFPLIKKWQETPGADWQHPRGPLSTLNGREEHPVIQVSWDDALAYCTWAGGRLPTEAEWEKAARGVGGRIFPWGNQEPNCSLANYWGMDNGCVGDTTAVGSYPDGITPYGLLDMAGNVLEWVHDWYSETYYTSLPATNPTGPSSGQYRVLRGGAWDNAVELPRSAMRNRLNPDNRDIDFGFRCAQTP